MTSANTSASRPGQTAAKIDPAIHLVSLSAVTWEFALVGRTRMLTEAWLRAGQPTAFVQVPSYRTALERLTGAFRAAGAAPVVRPWPVYPSRWWNPGNEARLRRVVRHRAVDLRRQLEKVADLADAVAVVVSPVWTPWLETLPFRHVVYDCIDDVAVHVPWPRLAPLYRRWEQELVQRACGAVVTAEALRDGVRARRPELPLALIRNGVDVARFQQRARAARPADLPTMQRPIVGFVGALYDWIDWELIVEVATALPECEFVFVGPHDGRGRTERLAGLRNVSLLGLRRYDQVPAYVQAFDVCWIPFDQSRVSRSANPVKIYEYLSLGKPVVSTPVADPESFQGHVLLGHDSEEIVTQVRAALQDDGARASERVQFAQANSWDLRAAEYVSFVSSLAG